MLKCTQCERVEMHPGSRWDANEPGVCKRCIKIQRRLKPEWRLTVGTYTIDVSSLYAAAAVLDRTFDKDMLPSDVTITVERIKGGE